MLAPPYSVLIQAAPFPQTIDLQKVAMAALILVQLALLSVRKCISSGQNNHSRNCSSQKMLRGGQRGRPRHTRSRCLYCLLFRKYSTHTKITLRAWCLCASMCTSLQVQTCTTLCFHSYTETLGTPATFFLSLTFCLASLLVASYQTCVFLQYHRLGFRGLAKPKPSSTVSQSETASQLRLRPGKCLL